MNTLFRVSNVLIAGAFATACGVAVFRQAPALWVSLDATFASAVAVVLFVGVIVVGFLTLEVRKSW